MTGQPSQIRFSIIGTPSPQGSKKAFVVGKRARLVESAGPALSYWRNQVSIEAMNAYQAANLLAPLTGPLTVHIDFRFPMPASRPKKTRTAGWQWKTTAPDIDKLCRSTLDALTAAALIQDDAHIAYLSATKIETTAWTGATVTITPATTPEET